MPRGGQLRHVLLQDRRDRVAGGVPLERLLAGQKLIEDRAEGKNVGAVIDRQTPNLLGGHVAHRAHDRTGPGHAGVGPRARLVLGPGARALGESEVEDLDLSVSGHEDVLGLQIAVDDPLSMGGGEPSRYVHGPLHGLLRGDRLSVEPAAQRVAFEELHHGIGDVVVPAEIEDRKNVRMR